MFNELCTLLKKPEKFTQSKNIFWKDEYISKELLKVHLDFSSDGASRKLDFIQKSSKWISKIAPPDIYSDILDLGCGPGLYTEQFKQLGYNVTGIDFSETSIAYAKQSARKKHLDIRYLHESYLDLSERNQFELATLIYCDYGALSPANRKKLLNNVYRALKPNGKFLLDVFSVHKFTQLNEETTWNISERKGFWSPQKYIELKGTYKYPSNVLLEQYTILTEAEKKNYYVWSSYFTKESLAEEAKNAGFKVNQFYGNVAGKPYHKNGETIAVLLEKI